MSTKQLDNHLFNLKFASKQLLRDSKRCEKEEKAEKAKLKKAIEKGNTGMVKNTICHFVHFLTNELKSSEG